MNTKKLPIGLKLGYGSGDIGGNLFFTAIGIFLLFYLTSIVKLDPLLAGLTVMIGRIWDAVTDPAVGYLSDRTRTKLGRRRPWILLGSLPLGIMWFLLFTNINITNQPLLFLWITLLLILLNTFYTFVNIPYNALTPDLTKDYDERTSLNGWRMSFACVGTLVGAGAAPMIKDYFGGNTKGYMIMGLVVGSILTISSLIPFLSVKEPNPPEKNKKKKINEIFLSYLETFKNKPFVLILIPWILNTAGVTIIMLAMPYYFENILMNRELMAFALLALVLSSLVFIPLCVLISKIIEKKYTYITGMIIFSSIIIIIFLIGHIIGLKKIFKIFNFQIYLVYLLLLIAGIGFSTHYVMPYSIVPDTTEYDYLKSGIKREGIYYGIWTFSIKIGQAFAALIGGAVLKFTGYNADFIQQTKNAQLGIRFLVGPIPVILFLTANFVLFFYPISRKKYMEIQDGIKGMEK